MTYSTKQYNDGHTAINPLTGKFNPNLLPEDVKASIRDLTGEQITLNERQLAKASMLSLGFSKNLSGSIKLTEELLAAIEKKYGGQVVEEEVQLYLN